MNKFRKENAKDSPVLTLNEKVEKNVNFSGIWL